MMTDEYLVYQVGLGAGFLEIIMKSFFSACCHVMSQNRRWASAS